MTITSAVGACNDAAPLSVQLAQRVFAWRALGVLPEVAQKVRLNCADALAIAVAARTHPIAQRVIAAQTHLSGEGPCRLFGGGTSSASAAAFINASLIHILDYDDIHDMGRLHPSTVVLPAVLAAADLVGTEEQAIADALAIATELICRLGVVCAPKGEGPGADWFLTQLFGYVTASVGAGLALDLTPTQMVSAIGLAYMQAAGGKQAGFGTGADARSIYPAFAAQGGLQAALLARSGMVGPEGALDGAAGLFRIYMGDGLSQTQADTLVNDEHWHSMDVDIKPWPSCRLSHPYISAALKAREATRALQDVQRVRVGVNASAARLCTPLVQRRVPTTLQDAKYSIPFMTAFTLVKGAPTLQNLNEAILQDEHVLVTAQRIEVEQTLPDNPGHPLATLDIQFVDGSFQHHEFSPDELRVDQAGVQEKFMTCLAYAGYEHVAEAAWNFIMAGQIRRGLATPGNDT